MTMTKREKGFTLIELLVVVALIGILASVVLASLNSARTKGNDSKVKSQLSSVRAAAEIYFATNSNYGTAPSPAGDCTTGTMFADTVSGMRLLLTLSNYPPGTILDCGSNGSAWSVAATLNGGTNAAGPSWCVDSTGVAKGKLASGVAYIGLAVTNGPHHNPGWPACE